MFGIFNTKFISDTYQQHCAPKYRLVSGKMQILLPQFVGMLNTNINS